MWKVTFEPADGTKTLVTEFATQAEAIVAYEAARELKRDGRLALETPDYREAASFITTAD